jgi:peptide/nickel transport system substrate-binding protein
LAAKNRERTVTFSKLLFTAGVLGLAVFVQPAMADTPKDTLVIAKQIDDIITLDPAEVFEFSGGEVIANVYDRIFTYEAEDTA